jgi:hypothetical protein
VLCSLHPDYAVCKDAAFYVKSLTPSTPGASNATGMNNILVRALFSQPLAVNTDLTTALTLQKTGDNTALPLTLVQTIRDVFRQRDLLWPELYERLPKRLLRDIRSPNTGDPGLAR